MGVLKPRIAEITLYHGDDLQQLSELHRIARVAQARTEAADRRLAVAEAQTDPTMLDDEDGEQEAVREAQRAAEEQAAAESAYDEYVTEAAERAVSVTVRAIGSSRFSDLLLAHPARTSLDEKGKPVVHEDDLAFARVQEMAGYRPVLIDTTTFPRALAGFRDEHRRTITDPDLSDDELAEFLDDDCDEGDLERIWTAAFFLNRGGGDPKGTMFSTSSPS